MSKTNDTSRPTALKDHRPLADSELDAVSGGVWFLGYSGTSGTTNRADMSPIQINKLFDKATP